LQTPLQQEHAQEELAAKQQIVVFLEARRKHEEAEQAAAAGEAAALSAKKEAFEDLAVDIEPESEFSADAKAVPFPPDARELEFDATFDDIEFASSSSLNALAAFYRLEMAKRSWKEDVSAATIEDDSIELTFKNGTSKIEIDLDERSDYVQVRMDCEELDFTGTNDPAGLVALGIPQPRGAVFLQKEVPLPDGIRDLEYESDRCNFKSSMKLQAAFDHFGKLIRGKGYRESHRPNQVRRA
jgi:hypothetical protein